MYESSLNIQLNWRKWDIRFLQLAKLVSTWSKDPSTRTGGVIVDSQKRIVSVGFNGFPAGMPDIQKYYDDREEKYSRIIHCEMNAVLFADKPLNNCILYTFPFLSCDRCFVHCFQKGITRFVAPKATPDQLSRWGKSFDKVEKYAKECGVSIDYYEEEELYA
jgi:dCMP deaminase